MFVRKITLLALLLFSAHFSIFSQEIPEGNALSQEVESKLAKNGFSPLAQELSPTGQDAFAYNLILSFPPNTQAEASETNFSRNLLIFCFTQEDCISNSEAINDFLTYLKNLNRTWEAQVLFSALDKELFAGASSIKGTDVFAMSVDDSDAAVAVTVDFSSSYRAKIHTASKSHISPLWLTQRICDAFFLTRKPYSYEDGLSAIYRLGIIKGQKKLSSFFENEIPAIAINFSDTSQISVLKSFAENYDPVKTGDWDMHYIYINRGNIFRPAFINEKVLIITCLSVGVLTVLILCIFSFIGVGGERQKYEFIRSSYMIPITIAISFLSLLLGQNVAGFLSNFILLNPIIQYGIKIVFSMIFISILFIVQGFFKFSITAFIYGYILSIVSIFNIFLFSSRDLTLFVIFAAEYLIIYFSKRIRGLFSAIFYFILMMVPFLPYGIIIIRSADEAELMKTVFTTASGNLLLALAILPFQISWLRMLVFVNVVAGVMGYTRKKIIINGIVSTIAILLFIFFVIFSISHFIYQPDVRAAQKIETKIVREELFTMSAKFSQNEFSGMNSNHIRIISELPAIKYEVTLIAEEAVHPIYNSIYKYKTAANDEGKDSYSFIIPDYPPKSISIDYAAPSKVKARVEITAYYKTSDPNRFRIEKRALKVE